MVIYHSADTDLRVVTFHINIWKRFHAFLGLFWWQKMAFISSLDLYFHPSIIDFRMGEKIRVKIVVSVSRGAGGRIFLEEIREEVSRNLLTQVKLCQRIRKWNLDPNLIMVLLIVAVCTVLFYKLTREEIDSFSFEILNIQIFKILKMFKYNMKFIRAACWINSKISNRDQHTTLIISYFVTIIGHHFDVIIEDL